MNILLLPKSLYKCISRAISYFYETKFEIWADWAVRELHTENFCNLSSILGPKKIQHYNFENFRVGTKNLVTVKVVKNVLFRAKIEKNK